MTSPASDRPVTILQPPKRWPGLGLGELWLARRPLLVLVQRSLMVRYRQAALGFAWVIIQPLVLSVIISIFLGLLLGRSDRFGVPLPVFIFAAWTAWRVFLRVLTDGGNSITRNATLVKRIYLPRAVFPLSVGVASVVDWLAMVAALVVLAALNGFVPGEGLLALPFILAIMYAAGLGVAFYFAAASLRYQDMEFVMPLLTQAWFWSSPVFYSSAIVPEQWRTLYYLNPLVVVIEGTRGAFLQTPMPPLEAWVLGASSATLMLVSGYLYFRQREQLFSDLL